MTRDDPNPLEAGMPSCHCDATDRHFTMARARDDVATYHRKGPTGTARLLVACVAELNPLPDSLLDVGAGIGVLHHELLDRGVGRAVHLEAARAYIRVAREECARRGHADRVVFEHGDLVERGEELPPAELVSLDRVVCCYPELESLIRASTRQATRYLALSYPHDRWYMRCDTWWQNAKRRRAGNPFRTFIHPVARIRSLIERAGFSLACMRRTLGWEAAVYRRA